MLLFFFNKLLRECLLNKDLSMWVIHFPYRSIIRFFIEKQTETKANKFIKSTNKIVLLYKESLPPYLFHTPIIMTPIYTMWATPACLSSNNWYNLRKKLSLLNFLDPSKYHAKVSHSLLAIPFLKPVWVYVSPIFDTA